MKDILQKQNVSYSLKLLLGFIVILIILGMTIFQFQKQARLELLQETEYNKLDIQVNELITNLENVEKEVLLVRDMVGLAQLYTNEPEKNIKLLQEQFFHFVKKKGIYDQLRYISKDGNELVRINYNDGAPVIVPSLSLQNKSDRYYFKEIKKLPSSHIYFSKFDLNVEKGAIEIPFKQVIRIGTQVFNTEGEFSGIVLLNFMGERLTQKIHNFNIRNLSQTHVLDQNGYFLISPKIEDNWGFMFPKKQELKYGNRYHAAWEKIKGKNQGQLMTDEGMFTFNTFQFDQIVKKIKSEDIAYFSDDKHWKVVSFISKETLAAIDFKILSNIAMPIAISFLLSLIIVIILTTFRIRNKASRKKIQESIDFLSNVVNSISAPMYVINPENLEVQLTNSEAKKIALLEGQHFDKNTLINSPNILKQLSEFRTKVKSEKKSGKFEVVLTNENRVNDFYEISIYPIIRDQEEIKQLIELISDVSEERLAEKKFKDLLASSPDGMVISDEDGKIIMINHQAESMFGFKMDELVHKKIDSLIPPIYSDSSTQLNIETTTKMSRREIWVHRKSGAKFPVEISESPIETHEGKMFSTVIRDITERKKSEIKIKALNENLELKVRNRTTDLLKANDLITKNQAQELLLKEIASIANGAASKEIAFKEITSKFSDFFGWTLAHVLSIDESKRLTPSSLLWNTEHLQDYSNFIKESSDSPLIEQGGILQKVLASKQAHFVADISTAKEIFQRSEQSNTPIKCAFVFPIVVENKVVAILEFFHTDVINENEDMYLLAEQVGNELANFISRTKVEQALRESEEKFRQLAENIRHGLWLQSKKDLLYLSPVVEKIFEFTWEQIKNDPKAFSRCIHPDDSTMVKEVFIKKAKKNKNIDVKFRFTTPNGIEKWIHAQSFSFDVNPNERRSVGIIEDITDFRKLNNQILKSKDEAERANRAKSEFLANMSHEIRTPMNAIIGFGDLLTNSITDEVQLSYLNSIKSSSKNLLSLINDILDLSKVEAGKLKLELEPVNIIKVIKDIQNIFSIKAQEKGLGLYIATPNNFPKYIEIDETRIRQILFNLIGNAIKFTEKGRVDICLRLTRNHQKNKRIDFEIEVSDTGIGFLENQYQQIFKSFQQQEGQSTKKYGGTGLGLAITRRLINAMGGNISVQSEVGKGSTFVAQMENTLVVEYSNTKQNQNFDIRDYTFPPSRILIVDDVATNRDLLKAAIQTDNLEIFEAHHGKQAIEMLPEINPDVILMDYRMPVMGGIEASQHIRKMEKFKNIPIIAATASGMKRDQSVLIQRPFDDFILKPIDFNHLIDILKRYINIQKVEVTPTIKTEDFDSENFTLREGINASQVLLFLEDHLMHLWKQANNTQLIDDMESFAQELFDYTTKFNLNQFTTYARNLLKFIDQYDVEKLTKTLQRFPAMVENFKYQNIKKPIKIESL